MVFFSLALLFRFYAYYCFVCMCVYTPCECLVAMEPDEGTRSLLLQVVFRSPIAFGISNCICVGYPPLPQILKHTHMHTNPCTNVCMHTQRNIHAYACIQGKHLWVCPIFRNIHTGEQVPLSSVRHGTLLCLPEPPSGTPWGLTPVILLL